LKTKASTEGITHGFNPGFRGEQGLGLPPSNSQAIAADQLYDSISAELDNRVMVRLNDGIAKADERISTQLEASI